MQLFNRMTDRFFVEGLARSVERNLQPGLRLKQVISLNPLRQISIVIRIISVTVQI